jgi:hypothetical protein
VEVVLHVNRTNYIFLPFSHLPFDRHYGACRSTPSREKLSSSCGQSQRVKPTHRGIEMNDSSGRTGSMYRSVPPPWIYFNADEQRTVEQVFSMDPVSPSGPSRPRSGDTFEFDAGPPAGSRRSSGPRRPAPTATGLNLWSTITFPVRLVIGILSGTWYFLGKSTWRPGADGSLHIHANLISSVHAPTPPPSLFRPCAPNSPRSDHYISLLCPRPRAIHRLLLGQWHHA